MARAPRTALVAGLQFAVLACVTIALVAVTGPFFPRFVTPLVIVIVLLPFALLVWHSARNLDGHVRAGAEIVAEALRRTPPKRGVEELAEIQALLPGLGDIARIVLEEGDPGVGRTLAELDLRSLTGANVIVIQRGDTRILVPDGDERLAAGDVIGLTGSHEGIVETGRLLSRASSDSNP